MDARRTEASERENLQMLGVGVDITESTGEEEGNCYVHERIKPSTLSSCLEVLRHKEVRVLRPSFQALLFFSFVVFLLWNGC